MKRQLEDLYDQGISNNQLNVLIDAGLDEKRRFNESFDKYCRRVRQLAGGVWVKDDATRAKLYEMAFKLNDEEL